jgi:hypothetical protein
MGSYKGVPIPKGSTSSQIRDIIRKADGATGSSGTTSKTREQQLADAMKTAKQIQKGITESAASFTEKERAKLSQGLGGVQREVDRYTATQPKEVQERVALAKEKYQTQLPAEAVQEEEQVQDVQTQDQEGEGPGPGGTLDNQQTNQMVDSGQLPAEQAELYPQGSQGGMTTQDQGTAPGGMMDQQATGGMGTPVSNPSVIDYMNATGMASDYGSRATLANSLGIPNYQGTADQNTEMLRQLRNQQAGNSSLQQGLNAPVSQGSMIQHENYMQRAGVNYTPEDYQADPPRVLSDYIEQVMDSLGIGEVSVITQREADELEELENQKDREMRDVNDNPWLTEGVRLRERAKIEEAYQDRIGNKEAKLARLQRDKELMVQQSQWALGTAISLWDSDRRFDQAQAEALYSRQQDALEWKYKEMVYNQGASQFDRDLAFKQQQADREYNLDWLQYELDKTKDAGVEEYKQNQYQAATYAQRASDAEKFLSKGFYTGLGEKGSELSRREFRQAENNFISAILRKESGAAISDEEYSREAKKYIPMFWDDADELAQKQRAREVAVQGLVNEAGGAYYQLTGALAEKDPVLYTDPSGTDWMLPNLQGVNTSYGR